MSDCCDGVSAPFFPKNPPNQACVMTKGAGRASGHNEKLVANGVNGWREEWAGHACSPIFILGFRRWSANLHVLKIYD